MIMVMVDVKVLIIFIIIMISFKGFSLNFLFDPIISADMNIVNIKPNIFPINNHMFFLILSEYSNNFSHSL